MIDNPLDVEDLFQLKGVSHYLNSAVKLSTDDLEVTRLSQGEYGVSCAVGTSFSWLKEIKIIQFVAPTGALEMLICVRLFITKCPRAHFLHFSKSL